MKNNINPLIKTNAKNLFINNTEIGKRLKKLRESEGLSQGDLANELGIGRGNIGNLELGKKGLSLDTLTYYIQFFCVSADYILYGISMEETDDITEVSKEQDASTITNDSSSYYSNWNRKKLSKKSSENLNKEFNEELSKNLGKNLRYLRESMDTEDNNMSTFPQCVLAEKLNESGASVCQQDISKYERGKALPSLFTLHAYCTYFKVSLDKLLYANLPSD